MKKHGNNEHSLIFSQKSLRASFVCFCRLEYNVRILSFSRLRKQKLVSNSEAHSILLVLPEGIKCIGINPIKIFILC